MTQKSDFKNKVISVRVEEKVQNIISQFQIKLENEKSLNEEISTIENINFICKTHKKKFSKPNEGHLFNFQCHFFPCDKTYKSRENLDLHLSNVHLKIKPYCCSFCDRKFSHRNGRIYHERVTHVSSLLFLCRKKGIF